MCGIEPPAAAANSAVSWQFPSASWKDEGAIPQRAEEVWACHCFHAKLWKGASSALWHLRLLLSCYNDLNSNNIRGLMLHKSNPPARHYWDCGGENNLSHPLRKALGLFSEERNPGGAARASSSLLGKPWLAFRCKCHGPHLPPAAGNSDC